MAEVHNSIIITNSLNVQSNGRIITANKGDLITDDGSQTSILFVGTDGQLLFANSGQSTGLLWKTLMSTDMNDFQSAVSSTVRSDLTITNVGTSGIGVYKQNTGLNYQFKNINNGSNKISISNNTNSNTIDIDTIESNISISNLYGAPTGTVVGTTDTQTIQNKSFIDQNTYFINTSDNTKKFKFDVSAITTNTTRTYSLPDNSTALVGLTSSQVLTNKSFGNNVDMTSNNIINLANPINSTDAANKYYVDSVVNGLDIKSSVKVTTTSDLNSNSSISNAITYNSTGGVSGRGQITATLSVSNSFILDGVTLTSTNNNSRILLKDQTNGAQNGIWTVTISGTSLTLDRASDYNQDLEVTSGAFCFIEEGTTWGSTGWILVTHNPITIGGNSGSTLTYTQFSGAGEITPGTGMTKNGNILNVNGSTTIYAASTSLYVNSSNVANQILLSSGTIGNASTFGALPLADSNAVSGILPFSRGGTGVSSFTTGNRIIQTNSGNTGLQTSTIDPSTIVILTSLQNLTNKNLDDSTTYFINTLDNTKKLQFSLSGITTGNTRVLTIPDVSTTLLGTDSFQTITNKIINTLNNTISNIADSNIASNASINANKIANGTVSSTSFQYLSGLGSTVVGISDVQNLSNKTLTSPKIQNGIYDTNGNLIIQLNATASSANQIAVTNSITGNAPNISAIGTDTNINLNINAKGTGNVILSGLKYPNADGTANQVLSTNGSGILSFVNVPIVQYNTITTTTNTATIIYTFSSSNNVTYMLEARVIGRRTDTGSESAGFFLRNVFRNNSNVLTIISNESSYAKDDSGWSAIANVSSTNIIIQVTGENSKTIYWVSYVTLYIC
jgi:hypothetical protein